MSRHPLVEKLYSLSAERTHHLECMIQKGDRKDVEKCVFSSPQCKWTCQILAIPKATSPHLCQAIQGKDTLLARQRDHTNSSACFLK